MWPTVTFSGYPFSLRAGIMAGGKQAASDVGERESWKEKKTDVCRDAGCE